MSIWVLRKLENREIFLEGFVSEETVPSEVRSYGKVNQLCSGCGALAMTDSGRQCIVLDLVNQVRPAGIGGGAVLTGVWLGKPSHTCYKPRVEWLNDCDIVGAVPRPTETHVA